MNKELDEESKEFEEHLKHYACEWCRRSFGEEQKELIEAAHLNRVQRENLQGTVRSYRFFVDALQQEKRVLARTIESMEIGKEEDRKFMDILRARIAELESPEEESDEEEV